MREDDSVNEDDLSNALTASRPLDAKTLENPFEVKLSDVGGMFEQKRTLEEVMLWPGKYADLFKRCGVRPGHGVLLTGPSGCGKTLLAKAFAAYTKFQTIFIKGPELLSKYIGCSEENVRNAFSRARASAPCILIFDELDSLAPRRGSDSTGVTDRVVNQLLTEMDGAEGLTGVFILGCTSRIDLIDPALLRPGRFDHKLQCNIPNEDERQDILRIYVSKHNVTGDFPLYELAKMCNGWTGADISAWFLNAQFEAARRMGPEAPVCFADLNAVFDESQPKQEKLQNLEFKAGQRVTLA